MVDGNAVKFDCMMQQYCHKKIVSSSVKRTATNFNLKFKVHASHVNDKLCKHIITR